MPVVMTGSPQPARSTAFVIERGVSARLSGLNARPELNGCRVDVLDRAEDDRWTVRVDGLESPIKVRAARLNVESGWPAERLVLPDLPDVPAADDLIELWQRDERQRRATERSSLLAVCAARFGLPDVTELSLATREFVSAAHLDMVAECCTRLHTLSLPATDVTDDDAIGALTALPALTALSLAHCDRVTDVGLARLAAGAPVESEEVLSGARSRGLHASLGAALGGAVRGFAQLRSLDVSGCAAVTDDALHSLAEGCPRLTSLALTDCVRLSDRGICAIARNRVLTALDASRCLMLTDTAVCACARACPLGSLTLAGAPPDAIVRGVTHFAARALAEECGGSSLTHLDLGGSPQLDADAVLCALGGGGRCPHLHRLRLSGCERLTGETLRSVLLGGDVPDGAHGSAMEPMGQAHEAVERLEMPVLAWLGVGGCPLVAEADRAAVRRARPGLTLADD